MKRADRGGPARPGVDGSWRRFARAARLSLALWLLGAGGAAAQSSAPVRPGPPPSAVQASDTALRVYVMTMGPGAEVWERFGHDAIWVEDPRDGTSISYNYGMFSFQQENFLLRFVQGRMWYWMAGFSALPYADLYVRQDRSVWVQELNLPVEKRRALRDFLAWNAREENKYYHYDYYRDNCATRVRDALDRVLDGRLRHATEAVATGTTYRWHTARLTSSDLPIYTGLMLGLGEPTDRPLSAWDEMFLPMKVRDRLRTMTVPGADGRAVPLVKSEYALHESRTFADPAAPRNLVPGFLVVGVLVGGLFGWLGARAAAAEPSQGAARWFAWLAGGWMLLVGASGLVLTCLWALTDHRASYHNENLFLVNLLALPLVVVLPRLAAGAPWAARTGRRLAAGVAGIAVLGLAVKLLPGFSQHNAELVALLLPAHLGLYLGTRRLAARVETLTPTPVSAPTLARQRTA